VVLTRLRLPDAVSDEEAGPIMCGGVTAYTACKRSAVKPGQWLVVTGAGGGLGHLGLQYAKAMGMRVIAIDGGDEKAKLCKDLGAEEYLDFTSVKDMAAEITRITKYGAHAVIVFAASKESYAAAPNFLRPGGTVVAVGLPADPSVVAGAPPIQLALKRLNIVGSVTGTLKDVEEAYVSLRILLMMLEAVIHTDSMSRLDFTARGLVHPILTKGTLDDVDKFCEMLKHGKLPGRAVLKVSS
jgi:propanol-preferring alcohol dehydrogenase